MLLPSPLRRVFHPVARHPPGPAERHTSPGPIHRSILRTVPRPPPTMPRTAQTNVGTPTSPSPKPDPPQQQLDRRMDLPLKLDVLGVFDRPYTPIDRRSDQGFTSLYAGVGRQENPRFLWTYYVGGSTGKDINHGRFLIETLEVDFKYNFYYTGISVEY